MAKNTHPGFRLRRIILDKGIQFQRVAEAMAVTKPTLSLITTGKQKITPPIALAIVKALGEEYGTAWDWAVAQIAYDMQELRNAAAAKSGEPMEVAA
ncbi:Antitoxin HigA [Pandoraea terrae]|uniref:Antitoxin HigA n=1 Tax=Pandoraea terrae TaxID=1537710 RepID=A0A5E4ZA52_9BURK|nr:hypothetical protein [Pandoraea terrae]VVE58221.1 Antitoxin HigA [Pandoraea terrae]